MTSHGILCPTTDAYKVNEIRVPVRLIHYSYNNRRVKELETLTALKLLGSRIKAKSFFKILGIHSKTGNRIVKRLIGLQWVGFDGQYIFPRSWRRLGYKKSKGLYLATLPKHVKDFLFTWALKTITKRHKARAQEQRCAEPKGLTVRYFTKSLNLSERTYYRYVQSAIKRGLLRTKQIFVKVGKKSEYNSLKKNAHGVPLFIRGNYVVTPQPTEMIFKI